MQIEPSRQRSAVNRWLNLNTLPAANCDKQVWAISTGIAAHSGTWATDDYV